MKTRGLVLAAILLTAGCSGGGKINQDRMQRALTLSGGYAGMTVGQLDQLSQDIVSKGLGSSSDTDDVLFYMVCSGRFNSKFIQDIAPKAVSSMATTGKTSKETVGQMLQIGGDSPNILDNCPN